MLNNSKSSEHIAVDGLFDAVVNLVNPKLIAQENLTYVALWPGYGYSLQLRSGALCVKTETISVVNKNDNAYTIADRLITALLAYYRETNHPNNVQINHLWRKGKHQCIVEYADIDHIVYRYCGDIHRVYTVSRSNFISTLERV